MKLESIRTNQKRDFLKVIYFVIANTDYEILPLIHLD
mgnify:CR=1 FL=1